MSNFPDFSLSGYQVERLLGENRDGGRVTYLANNIITQTPVVIKQFQFARSGATWSDYDAHQREIQVLRQLDHPSIPRYLDSFETPSGFCLVQEYIPANSLVETHHWTPKQIKYIAKAVLEVLVYLQSTFPPVIHRDIKPDNILVNRQEKKIYLIDFGFARMGGGEVAVSSVVKGTLGFMPPEQMFNRQLTEASDLYSLGVTLLSLLTQTKSSEVGNLVDSAYRINVKQLIPSLNQKFVEWLQKMVEPDLKNRFENAAAALEALQPIDVVGNTLTSNKQVRNRKLSPIAIAVVIASVCLIAIIGATKIISIISHSGEHHHHTKKHDKKKKHHYDSDDDEKKDQPDKGDAHDNDDDD
jgi:serine/threonine protein kinase